MLCTGILLATAQAARAEPTIPDATEPPLGSITAAAATTTSPETLPTESTFDWDATDEYGVTIYEPRPSTTAGPTTTTKKTSRTAAPFQWNPAHPEDTDTREPGYEPIPDWYVYKLDEHGNRITIPQAETTTEETTEGSTSEDETTQEDDGEFPEYPEDERPGIHWAIAAAAGIALLGAIAGVAAMVAKGRRDGDDDYIYEEPPEDPEA